MAGAASSSSERAAPNSPSTASLAAARRVGRSALNKAVRFEIGLSRDGLVGHGQRSEGSIWASAVCSVGSRERQLAPPIEEKDRHAGQRGNLKAWRSWPNWKLGRRFNAQDRCRFHPRAGKKAATPECRVRTRRLLVSSETCWLKFQLPAPVPTGNGRTATHRFRVIRKVTAHDQFGRD